MVSVARHLRDALLARGYDVAGYRERAGGHDFVNWRQALPDALIALLGPPATRRNDARY
jgi:enterochelin esterase-like enzyme